MLALFIIYYFRIVTMVYNAHISLIMVYKALLSADNIASIGRFREQVRENVEICKPQTRELSVNSIANSLTLHFLVCFAETSSYISMKANKRKVRKCLQHKKTRCWWVTLNEVLNNYSLV